MSAPSKEASAKGGRASKKRDIVTQLLIIALNEIDPATGLRRARLLADQLVTKAIGGDMQATHEVLDRVEGKAVQINENHNFEHRASEMSDDELAGIIAGRSSDGVATPAGNATKPNGVVH